jgi:hypothetical protein
MRSLLAFLGGALVAFLALGYYFNWYSITKEPGGEPGHTRIGIDINSQKVKEDVEHGVQAGTDSLQKLVNKDEKKGP